jgi:Ca2+-binding EF-hand superfamily protein
MELKQYSKIEKTSFIFQRYDTNKNGFLSTDEFKVLLSDVGYSNSTDKEVSLIVSIMD